MAEKGITGEVAERLERKWVCAELVETYLRGAKGRFERPGELPLADTRKAAKKDEASYYRIPHPGLLWNGSKTAPLPEDGGKRRPKLTQKDRVNAKQDDSRTMRQPGTRSR